MSEPNPTYATAVMVCDWTGCQRTARYFGLAGSALKLCSLHFPTHIEQLERDLNEIVGKVHVALRAAKAVAIEGIRD